MFLLDPLQSVKYDSIMMCYYLIICLLIKNVVFKVPAWSCNVFKFPTCLEFTLCWQYSKDKTFYEFLYLTTVSLLESILLSPPCCPHCLFSIVLWDMYNILHFEIILKSDNTLEYIITSKSLHSWMHDLNIYLNKTIFDLRCLFSSRVYN